MASSYAVGPGGWVERWWQREIGTSTTRNEATRHATHWPNGSFDQTYSEIQLAEVISKKNKSKSETENQPGLKSHFLCMFSSYATSNATCKNQTNVTTTNSPQPRCHKSLPASSLHWWRWAPSTKLQSCPPDARPKCSVGTWFLQTDIFLKKMEGNLGKEKKNGFFF